MDEQVQRLVDKAWTKFQQTPKDQRFMIAIGGIPGSGKTTLSQIVTQSLNARHAAESSDAEPVAAYVPMDGYHLTRAQLSAMPDPVEAHARRGAEFTFDGKAFLLLVKALREPLTGSTETIHAPSFDHAVKDPKADDIPIHAHHRVVVFEGNYVCLRRGTWAEAAGLMDERWFVAVSDETATARLVKRHVKAGIAKNEEEALKRAKENDLVNGVEINGNKVDIDEEVRSKEDVSWKHD
ncbi:P-loop containing nucleoside triphosphate hydrolase protein [Xylariaceae sp. FL0016]|nr:P-loop containing nucleoside triphosphate hydrolase protein [Xylariaceae sp. FL0016]